jgi:hypothetical protein
LHHQSRALSRRSLLKGAGAASLAAFSARGIYELLDEMGLAGPPRAEAAVRRFQEQYLIDQVEVILDNGVALGIPPLYNDIITAKLAPGTWTAAKLKSAQTRLERALALVEKPYPSTAAGLTIVVAWGLPYFTSFVKSKWDQWGPVDVKLSNDTGTKQFAVLPAVAFPSDPSDVILEDNHVMFKIRSDSQQILAGVERALFEDASSGAYVGDLLQLTSKRIGFLGRGFNSPSVAKRLAVAAGVAGADQIPDRAQLMMGFTSTQGHALGPDNIVSFETLPGVTNQWPGGYFAAGCATHLSHLYLDIATWYGSFDYGKRVARMFSPRTAAPAGDPVTLPNGPQQRSTLEQVKDDALTHRTLGHNATLQQATRLAADVRDNYGRLRTAGTAVPLREDFNTLDNPFAWSSDAGVVQSGKAAGMHFVAFVPTSRHFHTARRAMDGLMPDGTNLREAPYNVSDENNGFNSLMRASHRQNFVVPPRGHRSFPLAELL